MKHSSYFTLTISMLFLLILSSNTSAKGLSAEQVMEKAHHRVLYQGNSQKSSMKMTIIDSKGNERKRKFYSLRLDKASDEQSNDRGLGSQLFYIYFKRPGDIKKTAFLVHKNFEKEDDRWMYLPALDLVKRIASGDKRTSFVGSNFFYEDISGRSLFDDTHELVSEDKNYFLLKSTPKNDDVEFSYYKTWVHKKSFIPVSIEYYDTQGEKYRHFENKKVEKIDGILTMTKGVMHDLKRGEKTIVEASKLVYNEELPESIFTERYLRNPPSKYFR